MVQYLAKNPPSGSVRLPVDTTPETESRTAGSNGREMNRDFYSGTRTKKIRY